MVIDYKGRRGNESHVKKPAELGQDLTFVIYYR